MGVALEHVTDLAAVERNFQAISAAANPPVAQARVFNSANISVATGGAGQALTFNSERWNVGNLHSTAANTSRLTAPTTGLYSIGACVDFAANATGIRQLFLRVNGATTIVSVTMPSNSAAAATQLSIQTDYQLAAADYVEAVAFQNSGAALNVLVAANFSPEFWATRLAGFTNQL